MQLLGLLVMFAMSTIQSFTRCYPYLRHRVLNPAAALCIVFVVRVLGLNTWR
jgi:hypothetical protein